MLYLSMDISVNSSINQYRYNNPQFKGKIYDKTMYALEAANYVFQPKLPSPEVYRQYYVMANTNLQKNKLKKKNLSKPLLQMSVMQKSGIPDIDLEDAYEIFKKDFKGTYRYMSLKRFNNDLYLDKASVVVLKSRGETLGYYSANFPTKKNMYISAVDIAPKYRNTRQGAKIITDCWERINDIAKAHKCEKISLHVSAGKKNLIRLYQRLGFDIVKSKQEKYCDGTPSYYMEKNLGLFT